MQKSKYFIPIFLFIITLLIYSLSYRGEGAIYNYFVLLADAFLHGRFNVLQHSSVLNELVMVSNNYYVVYPPMPAVLLTPFVFIFGTNFPQPYLSILIGSINVALSFLVFLKIFKKNSISLIGAILFGFGTIHWYHAEVGSAWYIAHIIAIMFLWLSLLEIFGKRRVFLVGLFIGAAYLSRLPTILSIFFPLLFLHEKFIDLSKGRINIKNLFILFLGIAPFVIFNFFYNFVRFNTILDAGYSLLPIFSEPWYRYGLFNIRYIPIHIREIFTVLPLFQSNFPYVIPSLNVMSLWFVTPAFLLIPFVSFRSKLVFCSLVTTLIISIPDLLHGSNGFSQFGYRFSLDFLPFLLIVVLSVIKKRTKLGIILIALSVLINLWGVLLISHFKIWTI